jgi:plastocyanin
MNALRLHPPRLSVAAALGLVLAACASPPATTTSPAPSPPASRTAVTVSVIDSSFGPNITVPVGTTVVFVNDGALKHTASHGKDGQLVEGSLFDLTLEPGASDSFAFDEPGTYPITCIVHPDMNMTIAVE